MKIIGEEDIGEILRKMKEKVIEGTVRKPSIYM